MKRILIAVAALLVAISAFAEKIGSVDTSFHLLGNNATIDVNAFEDPAIAGVSCYLAAAHQGGMKATVGLATDTSDASVTCQKTGVVVVPANLKSGEDVFTESRSVFFKKLHVVRFIDRKRQMLVYLTYSDTLVDGSPKNSVSAVSIDP